MGQMQASSTAQRGVVGTNQIEFQVLPGGEIISRRERIDSVLWPTVDKNRRPRLRSLTSVKVGFWYEFSSASSHYCVRVAKYHQWPLPLPANPSMSGTASPMALSQAVVARLNPAKRSACNIASFAAVPVFGGRRSSGDGRRRLLS
jgi:hypothetical protein